MTRHRPPLSSLLALVAVPILAGASLAGCTPAPDPDPEVDEDAILAILASAEYRDDYVRVTDLPVLSQHGGAMVHVWVAPELSEQYLAIDPGARAPTSFPPGTLLIKEQLDLDGEPITATLLFKGPEGYNPPVNDWWFGTVDLVSGELLDAGPDIPSCLDCHSSAATSDYVHGLPSDPP
jgi:hypothetical protein